MLTVIFLVSFSSVTIGETLRIVTIALAPAGFKENGKAKGIAYEIANEVAQRANIVNASLKLTHLSTLSPK